MDLVEVAPTARPPVCKIMDYGKWRYQQQKKEDKSRASSRGGRLKMLNIDTIRIGDHDLQIKINHARDFLKEGNKVQFTLRFKGREMAHLDLGRDLMNKVKTELWPVSKVERDAKMEGRRMTLVLQPDHKAPGAKMPQPQAGTAPGRQGAMTAGSGLNIPPRVGPGGPAGTGPGGPGGPRPAPVGAPGGAPVAPRTAPAAAPAAPVAPRPVSSPAPAAPRPAPTPVQR
jgi:translation initiation factor IF-3